MVQRGRVSEAALATRAETIERSPRIPPPHDLNDEETEVYVSIINSEQADWFSPSTIPLLAQYCRHVIQPRRIAEMLEKVTAPKNFDVKMYSKLLSLQSRQSIILAVLATKMRISQQSTLNQNGVKKANHQRRPWD